jgi:hypothetical protein
MVHILLACLMPLDSYDDLAAQLKERYESRQHIALKVKSTSNQFSIENYQCDYYQFDNEEKLVHRGNESFQSYTNKSNIITIINSKNNVIIRKGRYIDPDVLTLAGVTLPITNVDFTKRTYIFDILEKCTMSALDKNTIVAMYNSSGELHTMHFKKNGTWQMTRRLTKSNNHNMTLECDIEFSYHNNNSFFPNSVRSTYTINGIVKSSVVTLQEIALTSNQYPTIFSIQLKPKMKVLDEIAGKVAIVGDDGKVDYTGATLLKRIVVAGVASGGVSANQSLIERNSLKYFYYSLAAISCLMIVIGLFLRRRLQ